MAGKRFLCLALVTGFLFVPCQRAKAPIIAPVVLDVALKCAAISSIVGAGAYMIFWCEPDHYLIKVQAEGETPYWLVSQASKKTVEKNEGWLRCEGPFKDKKEPEFRAWVNNKDPDHPMFPCGPLGIIPSPTYTNYLLLSMEQSVNGGATWSTVASTIVEPGEPNCSFALLPSTGTNGMTRAQLQEVAGCDLQVRNTAAASAIHRFRYESAAPPPP